MSVQAEGMGRDQEAVPQSELAGTTECCDHLMMNSNWEEAFPETVALMIETGAAESEKKFRALLRPQY